MADYDVRAFIEKRNTAMARNASAGQQAAQSMRAAGIANVGGKATTSSARDIQERFGRGLGSRKRKRKDRATPDVEDVGGVKSFMNSIFDWFNSSGASEPKMPPSYDGSSVYERSEFDIRPTPVTSSVLDAAPTGYDPYGIDTLNFGKGVDTNTDTAPETPESAKIDVFDPLNMKEKVQRDSETPGLMTPPSVEQPSVTGGKSLLTEAPETIRKTIESIMLTDPDVPYVIQKGDTLSEIAAKTGTTVKELQELNKIKKANEIFAGDELVIPSNKSTKTKEDIVSSLIGGMGGVSELGSSFEGDGVQTAMSIVPSSVLSDATVDTTGMSFLEFIAEGEGTYESSNRGTKNNNIIGSTSSTIRDGKKLSEMTIGEIKEKQKIKSTSNTDRLFAVGKYQLIPETLNVATKALNLSDDTVFTPAIQEQLGQYLVFEKRPALGAYIKGESNDSTKALLEAAKEFASMPVPSGSYKILNKGTDKEKKKYLTEGESYYGSGNKAQHTIEEALTALEKAKTEYVSAAGRTAPLSSLRPKVRPAGIMTSPRPPLRPENL